MTDAEKFALGMEADEEEVELATPTGSSPAPPRKMQSLDFEHIGALAAVAESLSPRSRWRRALTSVRVVIFQAKINVLLPFGPLAVLLHYLTGKHSRMPTEAQACLCEDISQDHARKTKRWRGKKLPLGEGMSNGSVNGGVYCCSISEKLQCLASHFTWPCKRGYSSCKHDWTSAHLTTLRLISYSQPTIMRRRRSRKLS